MCPLYIAGLIGPGDRKSVQPMAERLGLGSHDRLHHFVSSGAWNAAPLEGELLVQADRLVGGADAFLVIDDTALPKKGTRSVGVAPQYASALGKTANCQTLVSLTLARDEVPVPVSLRLFLPEAWTNDSERLWRAGVPSSARASRSKPEIALAELDRIREAGVRSFSPTPVTASAPPSAKRSRRGVSSGLWASRASRRSSQPRSRWSRLRRRAGRRANR
jgi:SRSO17 transposase